MQENNTLTSGFIGAEIEEEYSTFKQIEPIYTSDSGYTCLYQAYRHGRKHILKTIKPEYRGEWLYEQALRKEFAIGYQLEHPHIVRTLGWETVSGLGTCIVLEYVDGITLRQWMEQGEWNKEQVWKVLGELCDALQYLHNKQIVHRDLKPENILITYNGIHTKLIDFSLSDCDDSIVLKIPAGTRRYLAPECLQPGYKPNLSADIYSLGVIISELALLLKDNHLAKVSRHCMYRNPVRRYVSVTAVYKSVLGNRMSWGWRLGGSIAGGIVIGLGIFLLVDFGSTPSSFSLPVYGNIVGEEDVQRVLWEVDTPKTCEKDSLESMRQVLNFLEYTYPLPEMKQTPAFKTLLQGWRKRAVE